jgi:hypothetical protein
VIREGEFSIFRISFRIGKPPIKALSNYSGVYTPKSGLNYCDDDG